MLRAQQQRHKTIKKNKISLLLLFLQLFPIIQKKNYENRNIRTSYRHTRVHILPNTNILRGKKSATQQKICRTNAMRKLNKPDKGQKAMKQVVKQESEEEYAYNSVKKIMSRAQMRTEHFEGNESFIKKKKKL